MLEEVYVSRVPFSSFITLPCYEIREIGKEFCGVPLEDVALLFREDSKLRILEITGKHPLPANGHSTTRSFNWNYFTSNTWEIIKRTAQEIFPDRGYENCWFWVNFLPEKNKVDLTVGY